MVKKILNEFVDFIREYKVVPLAIAFIMGVAATALVTSLVNNIVMPLINPIVPKGGWQNATVMFGPTSHEVVLGWGAFLGSVINFLIIALVVFFVAKFVLHEEKVTKK